MTTIVNSNQYYRIYLTAEKQAAVNKMEEKKHTQFYTSLQKYMNV